MHLVAHVQTFHWRPLAWRLLRKLPEIWAVPPAKPDRILSRRRWLLDCIGKGRSRVRKRLPICICLDKRQKVAHRKHRAACRKKPRFPRVPTAVFLTGNVARPVRSLDTKSNRQITKKRARPLRRMPAERLVQPIGKPEQVPDGVGLGALDPRLFQMEGDLQATVLRP